MYAWVPESFVEQETTKNCIFSFLLLTLQQFLNIWRHNINVYPPTYLSELNKENNFCQVKVRSSDFCAGKVPKKNSSTHTGFAVQNKWQQKEKFAKVETWDLNGILISINSLFMTFGSMRRLRWLQEVISMRFPFKVFFFSFKFVFLLKHSVSSILHEGGKLLARLISIPKAFVPKASAIYIVTQCITKEAFDARNSGTQSH